MKFQITCDNCGSQFIISAESGQTLSCRCPQCQSEMEFTLPILSGNAYPSKEKQNPHNKLSSQKQHANTAVKSKSNNHWLVLLLFLLLVCLGAGAYFFFRPNAEKAELQVSEAPKDTLIEASEVNKVLQEFPIVDTTIVPPVPKNIDKYVEEDLGEYEDTLI